MVCLPEITDVTVLAVRRDNQEWGSKIRSPLDQANIAAIRLKWVPAVRDGDRDQQAGLVTVNVMAVLKDGPCINGKAALKAGLHHMFGRYDVERKILSAEVVAEIIGQLNWTKWTAP